MGSERHSKAWGLEPGDLLTRRRRISGIPGRARNDRWVARGFVLVHSRCWNLKYMSWPATIDHTGGTAFQSETSPQFCPYLPWSDWDDRKDLWDIFRRLWIVERAFQILFRFRSPILFDVWCARKETWKLNFFQRKEFFYDIWRSQNLVTNFPALSEEFFRHINTRKRMLV